MRWFGKGSKSHESLDRGDACMGSIENEKRPPKSESAASIRPSLLRMLSKSDSLAVVILDCYQQTKASNIHHFDRADEPARPQT